MLLRFRAVLATCAALSILLAFVKEGQADADDRINNQKTGHATGDLPSLSQTEADRRVNNHINSGEAPTPDSVTFPPGVAESQEQKPPSKPTLELLTEHEVDDLRHAIERDDDTDAEKESVDDDESPRSRRERMLQNREVAETVAWSYFLGTHEAVQDIAKARDMFVALASEGSPAAQFGLGVMYGTGIGMNVSQPKAMLYYTLAARGEYPLAWMALAFRYFSGHSTDYNCDMAALYYHNIASQVVNGMDLLGGQIVTRLRISDETDGSSSQMLDPEFVQYYQYLADKGESAAQLALGLLYLQGKHGVEHDIELAYDYLVQASENDNAQADAYLGKMYLKGTSVTPRDYEKAYHYFQRSAAKDNPMGMVGLGLLYTQGFHVDKDHTRAKTLFTKAAEQGNAEGQLQLGNFFFRNQAPSSFAQIMSSVKNMRLAVKNWNMASQQGNALAYYNLGIAHVYGHGTPRMCRIGTEFLKIVAERGKHSQYFMSAYEDARNGDDDSALAKYALLAELGYEVAHSNLAVLYERKIDLRVRMPLLFSAYDASGNSASLDNATTAVSKQSPLPSTKPISNRILYINNNIPLMEDDAMRRAFYYWSQSAELGYAYARIRLGDYHFYGTGTPINYAESITHYRAAAENHHNAQAMFNLGYMHEKGLGSKKDLHMAKRYYDMAVDTSSDAYLPCQLALSKLNVLFMWQQMKESSWYGAVPSVEAWLGGNWDLLLITLASMLLAAVWYYVKVWSPARRRPEARAVIPVQLQQPPAAGASGQVVQPQPASPNSATGQTTAAAVPVSSKSSSTTLSATGSNSSSGTTQPANMSSGLLSTSNSSSSNSATAAASNMPTISTGAAASLSSTPVVPAAGVSNFPGIVPLAGLMMPGSASSTDASASAPPFAAGSNSSSFRSASYEKKHSDDEMEREQLVVDTGATVAGGSFDEIRSSSARRRTSINTQQNDTSDDGAASSSNNTAKDSNAPPAWPSDVDR